MAARKNILKLARKISGPVAMLIDLDENAPEYKVLNCVVTDEMAEVALAMELRGPLPLETIAKRCKKPLEETRRLVDQLAETGVCIFHSENGVDLFELPVFVPGVMEKMMNNRAQCEAHPEIPAGFEEYARLRGQLLSPKLPVGASPMRGIPIQGAISIHRCLWEGVSMTAGRDRRVYKPLDTAAAELESFDRMPRQRPASKPLPKGSFQDGRLTFTEEDLQRETSRCLGCGAVELNQEMCIGCGQCTTKCRFDAIHLVKKYNVTYNTYEQIPLKMTPNIIKRVGRIAVRSVKDAVTGKGD